MSNADQISSTDQDRDLAKHTQLAAQEDIERTKRRQYEVTNYSALASAALAGSAKLFADDRIATSDFFRQILFWITANAVLSICIQGALVLSLLKFRKRLRRALIALGTPAFSVTGKMVRDSLFLLYFFSAALIAACIAIQYVELRACSAVATCVRLW